MSECHEIFRNPYVVSHIFSFIVIEWVFTDGKIVSKKWKIAADILKKKLKLGDGIEKFYRDTNIFRYLYPRSTFLIHNKDNSVIFYHEDTAYMNNGSQVYNENRKNTPFVKFVNHLVYMDVADSDGWSIHVPRGKGQHRTTKRSVKTPVDHFYSPSFNKNNIPVFKNAKLYKKVNNSSEYNIHLYCTWSFNYIKGIKRKVLRPHLCFREDGEGNKTRLVSDFYYYYSERKSNAVSSIIDFLDTPIQEIPNVSESENPKTKKSFLKDILVNTEDKTKKIFNDQSFKDYILNGKIHQEIPVLEMKLQTPYVSGIVNSMKRKDAPDGFVYVYTCEIDFCMKYTPSIQEKSKLQNLEEMSRKDFEYLKDKVSKLEKSLSMFRERLNLAEQCVGMTRKSKDDVQCYGQDRKRSKTIDKFFYPLPK